MRTARRRLLYTQRASGIMRMSRIAHVTPPAIQAVADSLSPPLRLGNEPDELEFISNGLTAANGGVHLLSVVPVDAVF